MGFCLYVAGGVFIQDQKTSQPRPSSLSHLEFILAAMQALSIRHTVTKHFSAQLELDMDAAGIRPITSPPPVLDPCHVPNIPLNGILAERNGKPMTVADLKSFTTPESSNLPSASKGFNQYPSAKRTGSESTSTGDPPSLTPPFSGIIAGSDSTSSRASPGATNVSVPGWEFGIKGPDQNYEWNPNQPASVGSGLKIGASFASPQNGGIPNMPSGPFEQSNIRSENDSASNPSIPNTLQYPFRQASINRLAYGILPPNPEPFTDAADWSVSGVSGSFSGYEHDQGDGGLDGYDWTYKEQPRR